MVKKETKETKEETKEVKATQYVLGNLKITEFQNTTEDGETYNNYLPQKFYKDKETEDWKTTNSLNLNELVKMKELISQLIHLKLEMVERK